MTTLTINTEDKEVLNAVKALLKGFKEKQDAPYNPVFVAKIKESQQQVREGKTVKYEPGTNLWDLMPTK